MLFTPAHIKIKHNIECALYTHRQSASKLASIRRYLADQRIISPSEYNHPLKQAVLIIMDAEISLGDCTSSLCRYERVEGKVRL